MPLDRRRMLVSLLGGVAAQAAQPLWSAPAVAAFRSGRWLRSVDGGVDWGAVRDLFPLAKDWTHLASFLFVSHPRPVTEAIDRFRRLIDADPFWIEIAALTDAAGRPFTAVKRALGARVGGDHESARGDRGGAAGDPRTDFSRRWAKVTPGRVDSALRRT